MVKLELLYSCVRISDTFEHIHPHIYISVALLYALKHTHIRSRVPGDNAPQFCAGKLFYMYITFLSRIGRQPYIIIIHLFIQVEDWEDLGGVGGVGERGMKAVYLGEPSPSMFIYVCIGRETNPGRLRDRRAFYH